MSRRLRRPAGRGEAEHGTTIGTHRHAPRTGERSRRAFALCLALFALAGCGDDDESTPRPDDDPSPEVDGNGSAGDEWSGLVVTGLDGRPAEELTSPWLVNTSTFRNVSDTPSTGEARVALLRYEDDFPISRYADFFARELDTCELRRANGGSGDGGSPPPTISGGETVMINTPAGPWLTLERQTLDDGTGVDYRRVFGAWPGALPEGAALSVPGDEFPNVAAYPIDEPPVPIRLQPDGNEPLGADTVYTWVAGEGSDHIEIAFSAFDPDSGDFIDFPLVCELVDDGSFELPEEARTFLATTTDEIELRYERVRRTLELTDGIVFFTSTNVTE